MKKVAIIGTVGVPANYGGFETLIENIIGDNTPSDVQYTIYCSSSNYSNKIKKYKKAQLKYISLEANGIQSIFYDIISLIKASINNDIILILGVSGCCFLPIYRLFSQNKLIINIDGLEHRRAKWNKWIKQFLKFSEAMAIKYADTIISDNKAIQDYVKKEYNHDSILIAYGGDHVFTNISTEFEFQILQKYKLTKNQYSFSVCRIEPENNIHITLEAFKQNGEILVFVGNWSKSDYGKKLLEQYKSCPNLILLPPIYDLNILNALRKNCFAYIHGHSAGGTNPSLVEAMFFNKPILAYDVTYNRETTCNQALYFKDETELQTILNTLKQNNEGCLIGKKMLSIAQKYYTWNNIAKQYGKLY